LYFVSARLRRLMGHHAGKFKVINKDAATSEPGTTSSPDAINTDSCLLTVPEELLPLMLENLDARSLCNFEQAFKLAHTVTLPPWEKLYLHDFPFCYVTKPVDSTWQEHYRNTYRGEVTFVAQSYYKDQLVCRNALARYQKYKLYRKLMQHFGSETGEEIEATPEDMLRAVPPNIRHLKFETPEVYIPPVMWSEFLKPGDEIELQWGSMHYWWRGVVEKIDGKSLNMVFTQFKQNSHFYREVATYGIKSGKCGGVRKIEEPSTVAAWKAIYGVRKLRMTLAEPNDFSGIG